jgi:hypothetical protein
MKYRHRSRYSSSILGVFNECFKGNVYRIKKDVKKYDWIFADEYCHLVRDSEDDVKIGDG